MDIDMALDSQRVRAYLSTLPLRHFVTEFIVYCTVHVFCPVLYSTPYWTVRQQSSSCKWEHKCLLMHLSHTGTLEVLLHYCIPSHSHNKGSVRRNSDLCLQKSKSICLYFMVSRVYSWFFFTACFDLQSDVHMFCLQILAYLSLLAISVGPCVVVVFLFSCLSCPQPWGPKAH